MNFPQQMFNPQMMQQYNNAASPTFWNNTNNLPQYNVIQVNGENGANSFQMGPNSKALLLDETAPIVWFVQTDGAGYKTVTPYSIAPYKPAPQIDINSLEQRLSALEEKVNAKSYSGTSKQSKKQQQLEDSNSTT